MTKTRLTNADRDAIRYAMLGHKFDPVFAQLKRDGAALAIKARALAYGDYAVTIDAAPDGAFPVAGAIHVNVGGQKHSLEFEGDARVFYKHDRGWTGCALTLVASAALGKAIVDRARAAETAKEEKQHLNNILRATLAEFRSFDDLIAAWPEAETFIKDRWRTRPEWKANVPAVALKTLTDKLDLPPDVAEAA